MRKNFFDWILKYGSSEKSINIKPWKISEGKDMSEQIKESQFIKQPIINEGTNLNECSSCGYRGASVYYPTGDNRILCFKCKQIGINVKDFLFQEESSVLKLEVGKRYIRRDGGITPPLKENLGSDKDRYPFYAMHCAYTRDGVYDLADSEVNPQDLIEEYKEPATEELRDFKESNTPEYAATIEKVIWRYAHLNLSAFISADGLIWDWLRNEQCLEERKSKHRIYRALFSSVTLNGLAPYEEPLEKDDLKEIFLRVEEELMKARAKFPTNKHLLHAFQEEAGEVTKAFLDQDQKKIINEAVRRELIQTITVAVRLLQEGDKDFPHFKPWG